MGKWLRRDDTLLVTLRGKNVSYKKCLEFFEGKTEDQLRYRIWELKNKEKLETLKQEKVVVYDIETTNFKANIGHLLSWAVYWDDGTIEHDLIKRREIFGKNLDKRIIKSLMKCLRKADIIVGYNSTNFDNKFLRTRCIEHDIPFFTYGQVRHQDVYYMAKSKLATHRKSLKAVSEFLGVAGKTNVNIEVWARAMRGDKEALQEVLEHNIADVEVTWKVYQKLLVYGKYSAKSI